MTHLYIMAKKEKNYVILTQPENVTETNLKKATYKKQYRNVPI